MAVTRNPFASSRIGDRDVRVLRRSSDKQLLEQDRPTGVQFIKYDKEDFFAVSFARVFQNSITTQFDQFIEFYNISASSSGSEEEHSNISSSALYANIRDYLYRADDPRKFNRKGIWTDALTASLSALVPISISETLTAESISSNPLWIQNKRPANNIINTLTGLSHSVKALSLSANIALDRLEPGSFRVNAVDPNILSVGELNSGAYKIKTDPPNALILSPDSRDTAAMFYHQSPNLDVWNEYAGSGFTIEIIFRAQQINERQTLLFKGGTLTTISGGTTAITNNIYEAGQTDLSAGASALSADQSFMVLSSDPDGIYFESWQGASADPLFAGRSLESQVDFLGNKNAPVFTELRVDLLSPTSFEIQVGDGDLTLITGTTGESFGGGGIPGGSGARYTFAGASASYLSEGVNSFNLIDGNVHHLIFAWSPTGTSHILSPVLPNTGNSEGYEGHIRTYLDGNKLQENTFIQSGKYDPYELFIEQKDPNFNILLNQTPPIRFNAGNQVTANIYVNPNESYEALDSQQPSESKGTIMVDFGGTLAPASDSTINPFSNLTASISSQITNRASTVVNSPAVNSNERVYEEQVLTLSGQGDGSTTGSARFMRAEAANIGFPEEELSEFTIELFFRTNADRDGASGSLTASRTGTLFSIGGTNSSGQHSPQQISLDLINEKSDLELNNLAVGWPRLRVNLFDNDDQMNENEHILPFVNFNAYPVTSLSGSFVQDSLTAYSTTAFPFSGYKGATGNIGGVNEAISAFEDSEGMQLPIYRSTPYLALSYSRNDSNSRIRKPDSLGSYYQLMVKQDIGLSADPGIVTGDFDEGEKNTLTSLEHFFFVDSNTAGQTYSSKTLNLKLPIENPQQFPNRTNSPLFINGIASSLSAAASGLADQNFMTFEVEEVRIWRKALTKKEMQIHAKNRNSLYKLDLDVDPLTEADLISQFTFTQSFGPSNTIIGSKPDSATHGFTRRRDSISFPQPTFTNNKNYFAGEIFELRGWVGALADPFDLITDNGSVVFAPGYEVYDDTDDPDNGVPTIPDAVTANEVGLAFARVGTIVKKGHIQRREEFIDNYLPLLPVTSSFTSPLVKQGAIPYSRAARSPKTNSMLGFWVNMENSLNSSLAIDQAHENIMTLYNGAEILDSGVVQYRDSGIPIHDNTLSHGALVRIAPFGKKELGKSIEKPIVGTVYHNLNTVIFDASDKYADGTREILDFADSSQTWEDLRNKLSSISFNTVNRKAMLQPVTMADGVLFNGSQNFTAYDPVTNEYFEIPPSTYITSIGFYNDANELLAVAKVHKPLRKNEGQTIVLKPLLDFSRDDIDALEASIPEQDEGDDGLDGDTGVGLENWFENSTGDGLDNSRKAAASGDSSF